LYNEMKFLISYWMSHMQGGTLIIRELKCKLYILFYFMLNNKYYLDNEFGNKILEVIWDFL
jgi:hypothetical protein